MSHDSANPTWINRPSRMPGPRRARVLARDPRHTRSARPAVGTSRIGRTVAAIAVSLAIALLSDRASAIEAGVPQAAFDERATGGPVLSIRYAHGLIDYQITGIPLKRALDELAVKTGMLAVVADPATAARPVSASAQAVPLEQGIKYLLDGFSFALYPVAGSHVVIVLSTPPRPRRADRPMALAGLPASDEPTRLAQRLSAAEEETAIPVSALAGAPQSLDEFRAVVADEDSAESEGPMPETTDATAMSSRELTIQAALLERALDALGSEHRHLHAQALDELGSLRDPRATEALIAATRSGAVRLQALEALGRHAVYPDFGGASLVQTVQRLADDSDRTISQLAREILASMLRTEAESFGN